MNKYGIIRYAPGTTEKARKLRRHMTRQERHLWYDFLRCYPIKFYRQRQIDWYIADFYSSQLHLVIEIDGYQHSVDEIIMYDVERSDILKSLGLEVIRFSNVAIDMHFDIVCSLIDRKANEILTRNSQEYGV